MAKYRWGVLILVFLMIFTSCNGKEQMNEPEGADTMETMESFDETITLATDGKVAFDIIYPNNSIFSNVSVWVDQIKNAIKKKSGAAPLAYHDGQAARSEYLILLGDTAYHESSAAMELLGIGGYSVTLIDKYIVISATDEMSMIKAVNWFCNVLLKKVKTSEDGKSVVLQFEENRDNGFIPEKQLSIEGNKLSSYTIVYPMNDTVCKDAATELRSELSARFGLSLKLSNDQEKASDLEILVGKTNREESKIHSDESNLEPMQYEYRVINKKISILGYYGNGYGIATSCDAFIENLMSEKKLI